MPNSYDEFTAAGAPRERPSDSADRGPAPYGGAYRTEDFKQWEQASPSITRTNVAQEPAKVVNLSGIPSANGNGNGSKPLTGLSRVAAAAVGQVVFFKRKNKDDYICFQNPGDKLQRVERKVTDWDIRTYPKQWDAYLNGDNQFAVSGTPLQDLYRHQPSMVKQLHASDIHSVEQLANLSETGIEALNGVGADGVRAAQQFLDAKPLNDLGAEVAKLKAMLAERDKQIAELQSQTRPRERPRL